MNPMTKPIIAHNAGPKSLRFPNVSCNSGDIRLGMNFSAIRFYQGFVEGADSIRRWPGRFGGRLYRESPVASRSDGCLPGRASRAVLYIPEGVSLY